MPNHVTNIVTIIADNAEDILESLRTTESDFDFNQVIPMPEDIGDGWYDWSVDNWGTKWNAYSVEVDCDTVSFDTAWSHPEPVISALSAMYPDAKFCVKFADEDLGCNCGQVTYQNGDIIYLNLGDPREKGYDEVFWLNFAMDVKGYDEEEKAEFWQYQNGR